MEDKQETQPVEKIGFGEMIRRAREEKGISMGDLEALSRISMAQLKAIEDENVDALPEPVYIRAFLRTIARVLDLDALVLTDDYMNRYAKHAIPVPVQGPESDEVLLRNAQRSGRGRVSFMIFAVLVALLGMGGYYYLHMDDPEESPQEEVPVEVAPEATPAPEGAPAPEGTTPETQPATVDGTQPNALNASQPNAMPSLTPTPLKEENNPDNGPVATAESAPVDTPVTPSKDTHTVQPTAQKPLVMGVRVGSKPCWIQVKNAAGKVIFSEEVPANQTRTVATQWGAMAVFGNAADVQVTVNGNSYPLPTPSKSGVVNLTINAPK